MLGAVAQVLKSCGTSSLEASAVAASREPSDWGGGTFRGLEALTLSPKP